MRLNQKVHLIARTRYLQEMKPLYKIGVDEVIPEKFEASVEIYTRVLTKYLIPKIEFEKLIAEIRTYGYEMFRSLSKTSASLSDLKIHLTNIEISTFRVLENSPVACSSPAQIELRKKYDVTFLAIQRNSQILSNPSWAVKLHANEVLFVLGTLDSLAEVVGFIQNPKEGR